MTARLETALPRSKLLCHPGKALMHQRGQRLGQAIQPIIHPAQVMHG